MAQRSCSGPELELQFPCAGCGHSVHVRRPIASGATGLPHQLSLRCNVCTRCAFQLKLHGGEYTVHAYAGRPGGHAQRLLRGPPCIVRPHIISALGDAGPLHSIAGIASGSKTSSREPRFMKYTVDQESEPAIKGPSNKQRRPSSADVETKQGGLSSDNMRRALKQNDPGESNGPKTGSEIISLDEFERMECAALDGVQSRLASARSASSKTSFKVGMSPALPQGVGVKHPQTNQTRRKSNTVVQKKEQFTPTAGMMTDGTAIKSATRAQSHGLGGCASRMKQRGLGSENIKEVLDVKDIDFSLCGKNGVGPGYRTALRPRDQNVCIEDVHHRRDLHHHRMEFGPPPRDSTEQRLKRQEIALPIGGFAMY